ncbi:MULTISPECIES: hypothetical protein [Gordonia]|uniref:Uncharacterized protein n=3 Tax=Gordonia TaxID=2053 RepID=A0A3G8JK85_9ACTN|nr:MULTISPECIES: hypothetical protein [Gordonia]ASR03072.1 hypothetical protein GCWB2_11375 [Gordonia rubripertincta]AZG45403.1 hypothetical protein D7316_01999 [Gordonia insulae]MDG6782142.1 hypothetical protein [Gordonia rubripertincta]NKY64703.1 hypothetical protein [Gordonia rubripertincta]GAB86291.1 hypothetical protein GORBP_071_00300 [Gordonia rubripertincta NBRC 101908]
MKLRVGLALASAVDTTNVIITRVPDGDVELTCGGAPMVEKGQAAPEAKADPAQMNGTLIGKRYVDSADVIEVLCTKPGEGSLALNGELLVTAQAKPLPASD